MVPFASYVSRGQSKPRLIFSRINGPIVFQQQKIIATKSRLCFDEKSKNAILAGSIKKMLTMQNQKRVISNAWVILRFISKDNYNSTCL